MTESLRIAGASRSAGTSWRDWARRVRLERKLTLSLLIASVLAGMTTFAATTGLLPASIDKAVILGLLTLDFALVLSLAALIGRRVVLVWAAKRRGQAGARLQAQFVIMFSIVAATPAVVVAVFSAILFDYGLRVWFSDNISTVMKNSLAVAETYFEENQAVLESDIVSSARAIAQGGPIFLVDNYGLEQRLATQTQGRTFVESMIFDGARRPIARAGYEIWASFDPAALPEVVLERARRGEIMVLPDTDEGRLGAVVLLDSISDSFLYMARAVDPALLGQLDPTRDAVRLYNELENQRGEAQIAFALVFIIVALLLLLVAVRIGLGFANTLTTPIGNLIGAAERVARGDFGARVPISAKADDIASLSIAFNRMTAELATQRSELLNVNQEADERRRFIEAVLGGVSSGVVGLDETGRVTLVNRAAQDLLSGQGAEVRSALLADLVPEVESLRQSALARPGRQVEQQITFLRADGQQRTVLCRMVSQKTEEGHEGLVCTFDDLTELMAVQRKAAWADIARRIAHEIKNPLTPIQLSAERLKRKYLSQITNDPETFRICTDTIVRQVGDIGRMVDEFSSFARMPAPIMAECDLAELTRQAVFLQQSANANVTFQVDLPSAPLKAVCDAQQIGRALTNILLNAAESIDGRVAGEQALPAGEIAVSLQLQEGTVLLQVADNGRGLPKNDRHRLTEPYVTTRPRGTGLGLAIVKKIMEEHGGEITLNDRNGGGAVVTLAFPANLQRSALRSRDGE